MVAFSSFDNVMKVKMLQIALDSTSEPSDLREISYGLSDSSLSLPRIVADDPIP